MQLKGKKWRLPFSSFKRISEFGSARFGTGISSNLN
jgi:hypothetical protein